MKDIYVVNLKNKEKFNKLIIHFFMLSTYKIIKLLKNRNTYQVNL